MNPLKILNEKEKKIVENKLHEQFEISEISEKIIMRGKEKMFLFSGSFNTSQIKKLEKTTLIERIGVYFAKIDERTEDIRLSIEGSQTLGSEIKKNIFEINEDQTNEWMKGRELRIKTGKKGFLILKHKNDFLGTGKASEEKIGNFIPKSRRLKERMN